jgi:hypothetical protein
LHRAAIGRNQRPPNLELNATNTFFCRNPPRLVAR